MIDLGSQKELKSIGLISGKENRYLALKNGRKDLKIEIFVGIKYGLTSCKNSKVEGDSKIAKAVETSCVRIEIRWLRKKIGEGRINMIGWTGNKTDRQLIYWKSKIHWGDKMTRSTESIGFKPRSKNKNGDRKGILMRCVEVGIFL